MSNTSTPSTPTQRVYARILSTFSNVDYVSAADRRHISRGASADERGEAMTLAADFYGRPLWAVIEACQGLRSTASVVCD